MSRRAAPTALKALGVLAALAAACVAAVFLTAFRADPDLYPVPPGQERVEIYVLFDALHSNIAVPGPRLRAGNGPTAEAAATLGPADWVFVGWGDERFYQQSGWSPARIADVFRAFFRPGNPSVVRLQAAPAPVDPTHPDGVRLTVSVRGFERMRRRMDAAFATRDGRPVPAAPGDPRSRFFKGTETFSILKVCNLWTGQVLHAAGVPSRPLLDGASFGLKADLVRKAGAVEVAPAA